MLADSTKQLIEYLSEQTGYRVSQTRPTEVSDACVVVSRVGTYTTGENLHEIDRPAFTVRCCAPSIGEATTMAGTVSEAMSRYKYERRVTSCVEYSAYDDSGPNGEPEYKLAYRITYR